MDSVIDFDVESLAGFLTIEEVVAVQGCLSVAEGCGVLDFGNEFDDFGS